MAGGERREIWNSGNAEVNADLSPKKDNGNLEKLETSIDIKSLQEQTQQLQQEQIEKARQELPALAEQIKRSAMFNSSLEELGQVILAKNSVKKAEIIKRFKENPHLKDTLEQNIQKLTATPKESYDKSELLQIQLYGYLFLDEQVAIDGSKGPQTNLVLEALQERDSGKLEVITKKITKILQHYPKSLLRKSVIQNLVQKAKQQLQNPESWEGDRKEHPQLQQIIQKKKQKARLTTEEIVMSQIYGNVFFDENILVDGIEGAQTKDIWTVLTGQASTDRAKQWEEKEKAEATQKKQADEKASLSKEAPRSSPQTTLQSLDIHTLVKSNPSLQHLVFDQRSEFSPWQAMKSIEQVFSYLTKYLDHTTSEQKNLLQDFTIDLNQGVKVVGNRLEIVGKLKNGQYKDTPISFSYDMTSGAFAINTLLQHHTDSATFDINPSHPNKVLFTLPSFQNLDTSKDLASLDFSPVVQENMELNIEKNRAISTIMNLFDLDRKPAHYSKTETPGFYHLFQLLDQSLTSLEECKAFRETIQHLSTVIWGEIQEPPPEKLGKPLDEKQREDLQISEQQDKKLADSSSLLWNLFNAKKRLQDKQESKTGDGKDNWLYLFLKRATPQITDLNSTGYDEHQSIDIKEISNYLSAVEQRKEQEYQGFIRRKEEEKGN